MGLGIQAAKKNETDLISPGCIDDFLNPLCDVLFLVGEVGGSRTVYSLKHSQHTGSGPAVAWIFVQNRLGGINIDEPVAQSVLSCQVPSSTCRHNPVVASLR